MGTMNIGQAVSSDLSAAFQDYSVSLASTDGVSASGKTIWYNDKFGQYLRYYNEIPELNSAIDAKATWTVGKGFTSDPVTTRILDGIKGWGADTFNTILENGIRVAHIAGDFFAEIVRDDDGMLINLKPLDPSTIGIEVNEKGLITKYLQVSKINKEIKKFKPNEIFHLVRNRVADQIHGTSIIQKLEPIILMRNEAMTDWRRVLHRNVDPLWIFHLDTDDQTKIDAFKTKMDTVRSKGENMYIPKDAVVPEIASLAPNQTLNPLAWIEALNNYFYEAAGVPKIIVGNATDLTEASAKISYLAFQQTIEEEQLFLEEQVGMQLGVEINLEFPASLENELLSDKAKDVQNGAAQPNDTTANIRGRT